MHLWACVSVPLPARGCARISICASKCMCVYCFVRVPLCTRVLFVREGADAGSLAGHICDQRLLLTLKL